MVEIHQVNFLVERLPWAKIEHSSAETPWPGYLSIQGRSPLALLAKQGTRVLYAWTFDRPLDLDMKCGVGQNAYTDGDTAAFEFEIRQSDSNNNALARYHCTLRPGVQKRDRAWQRVRLSLLPSTQGAQTLELRFQGTSRNSAAIGAFAEAFLRPAQ